MGVESNPARIRDPQDLEPALIARSRRGDVAGMVALYEANAVIDDGDGSLIRGQEAIRAFFTALVDSGRVFEAGAQRSAIVSGNIALTSTRLPDGNVTAEIARRQDDGTWLWVVDTFSVQ